MKEKLALSDLAIRSFVVNTQALKSHKGGATLPYCHTNDDVDCGVQQPSQGPSFCQEAC